MSHFFLKKKKKKTGANYIITFQEPFFRELTNNDYPFHVVHCVNFFALVSKIKKVG